MNPFLVLLCLVMLLGPVPASAQRVDQLPGLTPMPAMTQDRIAAVVNDNVITTSDIEARMKLAFLSSGLPDNPQVREHILPQILRSLIDEQLELQEAKRLDIAVTKEDIDKAMQRIAHDNHIPGDDMRAYLKQRGGSPDALEQQIRAGIAWNKVVQRELHPRVEVGDDEVDAAITRLRANAGRQEFLVSEIFLAVDNAKDEDQVKQVAENLVQQIKGGASFSAVARQFSQSTGAASGGDIGWIQEGQLPTELNKALVGMQAGQVAGPVRSSSGYHILGLREKRTISLDGENRETTLDLMQAFRRVASHGDFAAVLQEGRKIRGSAGCADLKTALARKFPSWHAQAMEGAKLSEAPSAFAEKVRDVPAGNASEVMNTDQGVLVVFVCARHVPESKVNRDAIMSAIGNEKLELQARRLQRDLRRAAYIDIRLGKAS